jgi:hypothetical protein
MRCRNCHTVMMDTDSQCPSCHTSAARATAAAPGEISKGPGLGILLPIFGGAIGGALYAGLAAAGTSSSAAGSQATRGSGSGRVKRGLGLLFALGGGLFLLLACIHFWGTWKVAQREPTAATAADLCRKEYAAAAPGWIAYTFAESKPTKLTVTRQRLENGGEVKARCLLVRAQDKWLVATVAPGFEGNNLVGRLLPADSPSSRSLLEQLRKLDPDRSALLPYEFNAVDGTASDVRTRYMAGGLIAFFGVVGLALGLRLMRGRERPTEANSGVAAGDWAAHSLPKR